MKKKNKKVNAAILIIGNEILSGRTQDKNTSFISNWLNSKCGISVNEVRIIPDIEKEIVKHVLELSKKLGLIQKKYKRTVEIGSYPFFRLGKIGVSIVCRSSSKIKLQNVNRDLLKMVKLKKIKILKI